MHSLVINLERRNDRMEKFNKGYELYGPNISIVPYTRINAIDAITDTIDNSIVSSENDFNNEPRVIACAMSHIKALEKIIELNCIAFVFEDDINFREDGLFKRNYKKIYKDISNAINVLEREDAHTIVYIGAGDVLPIHTNCVKSSSLLRSQEKSHIKTILNDSVGYPKEKNAYLFDWIGAFAYCISPKSAKYILERIKENGIHKAIDVYLKENLTNLIVYPLLTYHDTLEKCDSDIRPTQTQTLQ
jgi:GR25 family glycosyltransferase involved in LPS biosynthesis